jgi:hypothetical protein
MLMLGGARSFVSVTQQFNTTVSMGRLTQNVLLSFAQFERQVTGERIRDNVAASKKKGMWMGGAVPLGYDRVAGSNPGSDQSNTCVRRAHAKSQSVVRDQRPEATGLLHLPHGSLVSRSSQFSCRIAFTVRRASAAVNVRMRLSCPSRELSSVRTLVHALADEEHLRGAAPPRAREISVPAVNIEKQDVRRLNIEGNTKFRHRQFVAFEKPRRRDDSGRR